uniref:Uncharacterized protein n=1 Tax=Anopheles epiroticus TaxID=199890 RepID=A0A182P8N7_9DIPT
MDPTNPSAAGTASGGAILPTCSTISSGSSQMHPHLNPVAPFGAIGSAASGHGATGSGSAGGGGGGGGVGEHASSLLSPTLLSPGTNTGTASIATSRDEEDDSSNQASSGSKGSGQRRASSRSPPKVYTSLVSRRNSEDGYQRAGYQSTQQSTSTSRTGLVRRTTLPGHYQSIDRSHSFNDHDHDAMSRWYQYHQQRHPLSRTGSRTGSGPRAQRRRYSLRDDDDDSMPTGLNRLVSFESVGGHSSCSGLLTRHRVSHPSVASSSFDQFDQSSYQSNPQQEELTSSKHHQGHEQEHEHQQQQQQQLSKSISNGTTRGAQSWKNLRAVMAYYCSLRKIKRN